MSEINEQYCECCSQKIGYASKISRGHVVTLRAMAQKIKEKMNNVINMKVELLEEGRIDVTQYGNRTHMEKLGLIIHVDTGNFRITRRGWDLLNGPQVPAGVIVAKATKTQGSRTVGVTEEMVTISKFQKPGEYWEVPGVEIRHGQVYASDPTQTPRGDAERSIL